MNVKRFLLALTAVAMFAAVLANSASAAMTAEGEWYIGASAPGTTLAEGSSKAIKCAVGKHGEPEVERLVLTGTVGTEAVKLEATGIECTPSGSKAGEEAKIFNSGGHGFATGKLKFTGVTLVSPTNCSTAGTIETEALSAELYMDSASSTKAFVKFVPAVTGGNFATVTITGSCAAAGARIVKGFTYGEASNPTSTQATTQGLTFSPGIETTTESAESLKLAGNPAHLTGRVNNTLVSGEAFGAH